MSSLPLFLCGVVALDSKEDKWIYEAVVSLSSLATIKQPHHAEIVSSVTSFSSMLFYVLRWRNMEKSIKSRAVLQKEYSCV